jgi:molybdopterin-containing oxidoreductase family iron-sulfur binding subunit
MKTIPPLCPEPETGPSYWRGLEPLADSPEFQAWAAREFPAGASELTDPVSRRHFVKIMSASFLLAGLGTTGCRRPVEKILPFSKMPEQYVHGVPQHYATAMPVRRGAIPLVVKSHEGRPVKVEGNPEHPDSNGGTDRFAQASILNLYDPDRATRFAHQGNTVKREAALDFLATVGAQVQAAGGRGLAVLLEQSPSPSRARVLEALAGKLPAARFFSHEPVDFSIHRQAASLAFGQPVEPDYRLAAARVVVSLDADLLGDEEHVHRHIRGFAERRRLVKPEDQDRVNRLYAVEGLMSLTGANADHRLRLAPSSVFPLACLLLAELFEQTSAEKADARAAGLRDELRALGGSLKVDPKWIQECARDLVQHPGESLVVAGSRQPLPVHLLALACNVVTQSLGRTVLLRPDSAGVPANTGGIKELAAWLNTGEVETLVLVGANPVYDAPVDLDWAAAQRKAKTVLRLGYHEDETGSVVDWHYPSVHYLEAWGDARTPDGTLVPVQPLIQPLFGGLTDLEFLARLGGLQPLSPYDIVKATFSTLAGEGEEAWKRFLHDGFLAGRAAELVTAPFQWEAIVPVVLQTAVLPPPSVQHLELVFHRDYRVDDGRYANNGWLQELPDPVTKMTWENVVLMSLATAKGLGLDVKTRFPDNKVIMPVVRVQLGTRQIEGPVWVQPGMADHVIGLALGYGRPKAGRVGRNCGFNAYALRGSDAMSIAPGAKVTGTGRTHVLATTQTHWAMEGRPVIREANLAQYRDNPAFVRGMDMHEPPVNAPLYPNPLDARQAEAPHQWAMVVDLTACVGCSACVVACQSENNIPIVGKEQVTRSREMHWLRIDRYYSGDPAKSAEEQFAEPQVVMQPVMCQHCEAAPCESVCPVNATVHDEEGLNVMAYNRCVGTRYCSNNCPYKVRRFNFFDYHKRPLDQLYRSPLVTFTDGEWEVKRWFKDRDRGNRKSDEWELLKLARNPEVTVRMRGIMEKCTYCVQRLEQAKIAQKVKAGASGDVVVREGEVRTACQQACPAQAISFGNLKDPASEVSRWRAHERNYSVLEFLLTKPRTTYLAKVRNPNPALPGTYDLPLTVQEYVQKQGNNPFEKHGTDHGADRHAPAQQGKGGH